MPGPVRIHRLIVSPFETNCYLIADPDSRQAIVLDPGADADSILRTITAEHLTPIAIVNTHAHADHIAANLAVSREFGCPVMIHSLDAPGLTDAVRNLASFVGYDGPISPEADSLLADGDDIVVGAAMFRVIHTPGHTPGGICLFGEGVLFSGDTLFAGGIGRTDFPGGSYEQLMNSIRTRLLVLPDDTVVYPGHGPETTIGRERNTNPWL